MRTLSKLPSTDDWIAISLELTRPVAPFFFIRFFGRQIEGCSAEPPAEGDSDKLSLEMTPGFGPENYFEAALGPCLGCREDIIKESSVKP